MTENRFADIKRYNLLLSEIDGAYHEAALKFGLSDSVMMILYVLLNSGENCLLSEIVTMTGASKQTINSGIRKLEKEGIIYLENFKGKRKKVCFTEKGKELAENTVLKIIENENEIYNSWSEQEWNMYIELTQRYLDALREKIKEF